MIQSVDSALLISLISVLVTRTANLIVHSDHMYSQFIPKRWTKF